MNGIAVTEGGELAPAAPARPRLCFSWRRRVCAAELAPEGLRFSAWVGRVPATASGPARRMAVLSALPDIARGLPEGWRMHLSPDHRLEVRVLSQGAYPTRITTLLADLVRFALALDPLCDALDAAGAELPPA